jgi:uncharacterized protein (UPF0333 family)
MLPPKEEVHLNKKGQGLVEYLVLVCLIVVSSILVVSSLGRSIASSYANISHAITKGDAKAVTVPEVKKEAYGGRHMGNYMENAKGSTSGFSWP